MVEELNCEELENEKKLIIQLLCKSKQALPLFAFTSELDISRDRVKETLECLKQACIVCETEWKHNPAYDLCDRKKTCVGTSNVSNAQDIADAQGGFMG